jgi:hypothetical protein
MSVLCVGNFGVYCSRVAWVRVQGYHLQVLFRVMFMLMVGTDSYGNPLFNSLFFETFKARPHL